MDIHLLNRKKNIFFRYLKLQISKFLFDKRNNHSFSSIIHHPLKKILFLRHDNKLGDMTVCTLAFREFKKNFPNAEIIVVAGPNTRDLIKNNPHVSQIVVYKKSLFDIYSLGKKLAKEHIDLCIDMDIEPTPGSILLFSLIKPLFLFGFNREKFNMYNITEKMDFSQFHITEWYKKLFEKLGILDEKTEFDTSYDLFIPSDVLQEVSTFLNKLPRGRKNIVFNPFSASKHRMFSFEQAKITAEKFDDYNIILIGAQRELESFGNGKTFPVNLFKCSSSLYSSYGVWTSIALLSQADYVISPDTFVVHAASSFKKPIYSICTLINKTRWAPLGSFNLVVPEGIDFNKIDIMPLLNKIKL